MNDNLKPFDTLAEEVQREIRSKGGKARAEKVRRIKTFQEIGEALSKATLKEGEIFELDKIRDIGQLKGANLSIKEIMFWKQVQKALDGDTKAFEVVRDTMGEKPTDKVALSSEQEKFAEVLKIWGDKREE